MTKTKNLFALFLSVLMLFTIATVNMSVFAAVTGSGESRANETVLTAGAKGTLTISNAEDGDTFTAYQVMSITYDEATNNLVYKPHDNFTAFLTTADIANVTTFDEYQALEDQSTIKTVLAKYAAYAKTHGTSSFTITGNQQKTDVDLGQYVLTGASTTGAKVFQVMTASYPVTVNTEGNYVYNKDVIIEAKMDTPSIEKTLTDSKLSVAVGDQVSYTVKVTVPSFPEDATNRTFQIHDTMSEGLTFNNDITVKGSADGVNFDATLLENTDYSILAGNGDKTFTLDFTYDHVKTYQSIEVTYTATVNSNAVLNSGSSTNNAELVFSNDPYGEASNGTATVVPPNNVTVYTYGILATVVDADAPETKLSDVAFEVYNSANDQTPLKFSGSNGVYTYDPNGTVTTLVTDSNGNIKIQGLDLDTYTLKETHTNSGYQLPTTGFAGSLSDTTIDGILDNDIDNILDLTITNAKITTTLPQTGGIGTYVFVVIGLGIMVVAVVAIKVIEKKAKKVK